MNPNDWDISDESKAPWVAGEWGNPTTRRDTTANYPARLGDTLYPVEFRAITLHVFVAVWMPIIFFCGKLVHATGMLPEIIVFSTILGFILGVGKYLKKGEERAQYPQHMPGVRPSDLPPPPSFFQLVILPIFLWPTVLIAIPVYAVWCENQFVAIALPALLAAYSFYYLGGIPIEFLQEYLKAQPEVAPTDRKYTPRGTSEPNIRLLLVVLFVLLTAPILLSAAHTYLLLFCLLAGVLVSKLTALGHRSTLRLLFYLLQRSRALVRLYLDQPDPSPGREDEEWRPPTNRQQRLFTFSALLVPLYAVLITGTTYYCPWEFFAALFVPDFKTNFLLVPDVQQVGYAWLYTPFTLAFQAVPVAGYLLTFVAAIVGFILFPPALVGALYFDRLIELEEINQDIKAARRSQSFTQ